MPVKAELPSEKPWPVMSISLNLSVELEVEAIVPREREAAAGACSTMNPVPFAVYVTVHQEGAGSLLAQRCSDQGS